MSIITKKGDDGFTQLFDGTVVKKSEDRPETYGIIDELFSFLGIVKDKIRQNNKFLNLKENENLKNIILDESYNEFKSYFLIDEDIVKISIEDLITLIQKRLMYLMSELAVNKENCDKFCKKRICENDITLLEQISYSIEKETGGINSFIIPGKNEIESHLNYSRTIARKAERKVVSIKDRLNEDSKIIPFLNRLSDLLFLIAFYYS